VPALDRLRGTRVVADPAAIDALLAGLPVATVVIRPAPDDAFLDGVAVEDVHVADPHAIVEREPGFVGAWCTLDDLRPHLEWSPPSARPALAQGSVAGVPAKLWIVDDERVFLVTAAAHADVLAERLRWTR
jgi:hypothetical protein